MQKKIFYNKKDTIRLFRTITCKTVNVKPVLLWLKLTSIKARGKTALICKTIASNSLKDIFGLVFDTIGMVVVDSMMNMSGSSYDSESDCDSSSAFDGSCNFYSKNNEWMVKIIFHGESMRMTSVLTFAFFPQRNKTFDIALWTHFDCAKYWTLVQYRFREWFTL